MQKKPYQESSMSKNNKLGLVVGTKDYAFWKNTIDETKVTIQAFEYKLKFEKAVLVMATAKLLRCPKPLKA